MPVRAVGPKRAKARVIILAQRPLRVSITASVSCGRDMTAACSVRLFAVTRLTELGHGLALTMLAVAACIPLALVLLVLGSNMSVRAVRVVAHACDPTQSDSIGQRFAPSDGRRMHTPSIEESAWRHLLGVYLVKEIAVLAALALLPQPMLKSARIGVWCSVLWGVSDRRRTH
jgi:hypothetical protein